MIAGENTPAQRSRTVGRLEVGVASRAVGGGVVLEVEEKSEHAVDENPYPFDFVAENARELENSQKFEGLRHPLKCKRDHEVNLALQQGAEN